MKKSFRPGTAIILTLSFFALTFGTLWIFTRDWFFKNQTPEALRKPAAGWKSGSRPESWLLVESSVP